MVLTLVEEERQRRLAQANPGSIPSADRTPTPTADYMGTVRAMPGARVRESTAPTPVTSPTDRFRQFESAVQEPGPGVGEAGRWRSRGPAYAPTPVAGPTYLSRSPAPPSPDISGGPLAGLDRELNRPVGGDLTPAPDQFPQPPEKKTWWQRLGHTGQLLLLGGLGYGISRLRGGAATSAARIAQAGGNAMLAQAQAKQQAYEAETARKRYEAEAAGKAESRGFDKTRAASDALDVGYKSGYWINPETNQPEPVPEAMTTYPETLAAQAEGRATAATQKQARMDVRAWVREANRKGLEGKLWGVGPDGQPVAERDLPEDPKTLLELRQLGLRVDEAEFEARQRQIPSMTFTFDGREIEVFNEDYTGGAERNDLIRAKETAAILTAAGYRKVVMPEGSEWGYTGAPAGPTPEAIEGAIGGEVPTGPAQPLEGVGTVVPLGPFVRQARGEADRREGWKDIPLKVATAEAIQKATAEPKTPSAAEQTLAAQDASAKKLVVELANIDRTPDYAGDQKRIRRAQQMHIMRTYLGGRFEAVGERNWGNILPSLGLLDPRRMSDEEYPAWVLFAQGQGPIPEGW